MQHVTTQTNIKQCNRKTFPERVPIRRLNNPHGPPFYQLIYLVYLYFHVISNNNIHTVSIYFPCRWPVRYTSKVKLSYNSPLLHEIRSTFLSVYFQCHILLR